MGRRQERHRGREALTEQPKFRSTTLGELFGEVADAFPDAVAYVEGDERVTFSEWVRRADSLAATLAERGVGSGDVVALLLPSSIDFAVGYAAASRLGAVATGVNTRLGPNEITAILGKCTPAALIHESAGDPVPVGAFRPGVVMSRAEMPRAAAQGRALPSLAAIRPEDPACIVWTSGTTGMPKGAWFDHRALRASAEMSGILSAPFDRRSMPIPFAHAGYMNKVWDQLAFVITCVLLPGAWSAEAMLDLMVRERITGGQGVPTQWAKLVDLPELATADLSSLRLAGTGSAPVSPELAEKMRTRLGCPIVVRYACTESSTMTGTEPGDPVEVLLHTVGRPLPGVEMVLVSEDGEEVPQGETGIIRMRTRCQMRGYWNDPERTAETMSSDGWIQTGDLGFFRDDGNLVLCGRITEMYIRGGYNVYPLEVENVLAEHPGVERVAVLGHPAPVIGEIGVAFVVPADPASPPTADELERWCRERLADYKAPDRVEFVDALPITPTMMKIDKTALRAHLT
ncbi:MAG: class I adenylate-forming enzyme family protein [Acidimicrobiia bacterium]